MYIYICIYIYMYIYIYVYIYIYPYDVGICRAWVSSYSRFAGNQETPKGSGHHMLKPLVEYFRAKPVGNWWDLAVENGRFHKKKMI